MGAIHVHEFMSLDGVIDAPTWTFDYGFDPKMGEAIGAVTGALAGHPARAHDVRDVRAGVVDADGRGRSRARRSSTTRPSTSSPGRSTTATWRNSELLGPYDADAIRRLKDEVDGDLYVSGSGTLVRAMLADGLVDELHLFVYPLTRGAGPAALPRRRRAAQAVARRLRVLRQRRRLPGVPAAGRVVRRSRRPSVRTDQPEAAHLGSYLTGEVLEHHRLVRRAVRLVGAGGRASA